MNIYMIGIGGSSMSFLAQMLAQREHIVRGSDRVRSSVTDALCASGIKVTYGSSESVSGSDLVVYTGGVGEDHPQLCEARSRGIRDMERAELLGLLAKEYSPVVAVAGTHGKTTTAAMLARAIEGLNPTLHIGGEGSRIGGELLVTEACEYRNSFLTLKPDLAIVLNVECDHPDFYKSDAELSASFGAFCANVRPGGTVIATSERAIRLAEKSGRQVVRIGTDYAAERIVFREGKPTFDVMRDGKAEAQLSLKLVGEHAVGNALSAYAAARMLGVSANDAARGIAEFGGVPRRWETKGRVNGAPVIADYAHHPTQIRACIAAARKVTDGRVLVVFQPHTYSRTLALFSEFVNSLSNADYVWLDEIYAAREQNVTVTSERLAGALSLRTRAAYAPRQRIVREVKSLARRGDILLVLGAGDIVELCPAFCDPEPEI